MEKETTPDEVVERATEEEFNDEPTGNEEPKEESKEDSKEPSKEFTKRQRLEHAKSKIDKQLAELDNEDKPLTRKDLEKIEREKAHNSAIEMANAIEDEAERKEVIAMLEENINPSGDAEKDFRIARAAANSIRNEQIMDEMARKKNPNAYASTPGAPGATKDQFQPTEAEAKMMKEYGLTQEDVIKSRRATQERLGR